MRELKFRAWDFGQFPKMDYNVTIMNGVDWSCYDDCDIKGRAIMQYTGLKDKNGVEIYEGDIISDPNWWWGAGEVLLNRGECGPCKGDSVMSYICRNSKHTSHNIWNGKEVEVIGNIYENPELLTKELK